MLLHLHYTVCVVRVYMISGCAFAWFTFAEILSLNRWHGLLQMGVRWWLLSYYFIQNTSAHVDRYSLYLRCWLTRTKGFGWVYVCRSMCFERVSTQSWASRNVVVVSVLMGWCSESDESSVDMVGCGKTMNHWAKTGTAKAHWTRMLSYSEVSLILHNFKGTMIAEWHYHQCMTDRAVFF